MTLEEFKVGEFDDMFWTVVAAFELRAFGETELEHLQEAATEMNVPILEERNAVRAEKEAKWEEIKKSFLANQVGEDDPEAKTDAEAEAEADPNAEADAEDGADGAEADGAEADGAEADGAEADEGEDDTAPAVDAEGIATVD